MWRRRMVWLSGSAGVPPATALARVTRALALPIKRGDLSLAIRAWFRLDAVRNGTFANFSDAYSSLTAHPRSTALARCKLRAADVSLDLMNDRELRDAVEEAKPPKGR